MTIMTSPKPIDPIGQDTYKGLAVPAFGDSVIRKQTTQAGLTLMHGTANTGRLFLGIDYQPDNVNSSLLKDLAVCDIDAEGGFRTVSGTTVKFELNTSGLFFGSYPVIDTSGSMFATPQPSVAITTGAAYTVLAANAGALHIIGCSADTSQEIKLPKNPVAGTWFDFYMTTQDAVTDVAISCTANSSAYIVLPGVSASLSTCDRIESLTTCSQFIRMTALSSVIWFAHCTPGYSAAVTTNFSEADLNQGHWGPGTTA